MIAVFRKMHSKIVNPISSSWLNLNLTLLLTLQGCAAIFANRLKIF